MNFTTRALSALVVAIMLIAALSGGALAAPAITTDSDVDEGDMIYVDASEDDPLEIEFTLENTGTDTVSVTVTDLAEDDTETNTQLVSMTDADATLSSDADGVWTAEVSHEELANSAERDLGETYEVEVEIVHEYDTDQSETTTITHDAEIVATADNQRVLVSDGLGDADVGADVIVESDDGILGFFAAEFDTYDASNNHPNGFEDYSNVTYVMDGDAADAYDDAADGASNGDLVAGSTVMVHGELVPVYADSAGNIHSENGSYAVYDSETSELEVELGEDRADAFATDVRVINSDPISEAGWTTVISEFGVTEAVSAGSPF